MDRITGRSFACRSEVFARHGMAATSQPLATQVALELLRAGGSAVDAAIGANAMLALVEPTGCGPGGDLFALVHDARAARLFGLNASGRSPAKLGIEALHALGLEHIPPRGPLSLSVPGCVDGWFELHERFGRLPMERVLAPAVAAAREGAPISETIAWHWEHAGAALSRWPGFGSVFLPGGRAPRKGELFANPALATTLEVLGAEGREPFYRGRLARALDAFLREAGAPLALEDLCEHRSEWVEPLCTSYRGVELWELPPNGQGLAAIQMLNVLEGFDLAGAGFGSADHLHLVVEAKKLAFEDRARLYADPDFAALPIARLASKEHAAELRARIDPARAALAQPASSAALRAGDTVCLATADAGGQMVSLLQSNFRGFGSGLTPPELGFCVQNRGELFDLRPGRANTYAPRKRPFHTIIPAFLTRGGEPWVAFGVMGGDVQPQGHAAIVTNLVDFGMNLQEAGDAPRAVHEGSSDPTGRRMHDGGRVLLESGFAPESVRELERRGHRIGSGLESFGGYQAVARERGVLVGASESREDGQAAGF